MKKPAANSHKLLDQRNALTQYLDALLSEVDWQAEEVSVSSLTVDSSGRDSRLPAQANSSETAQSVAPIVSLYKDESEVSSSETAGIISGELKPQQPSIPSWAQSVFQCLRFRIGDIEFTTPLDKLNGIIEWPENITSLPGGAPWFAGLVRNRDQNVQLVDLQVLMHQKQRVEQNVYHGHFVMLFDGGRWGLICDEVSTVLSLTAEHVKWQIQPNVPFIVGTVIEQMCSLVDVDILIRQLNECDK